MEYRRPKRALTLLELIVTMIIIAVLAALAMPSLQRATSNVALLRDEDALVNLTTIAQTVAVDSGRQTPTPADFISALTAATYTPSTNPLITNPTTVITDPAPGTGPAAPSTQPGQVSVNAGTTTTNANGKAIPVAGAAMLTNQGDCVMVYITPSRTQSFYYTANPSAPVECSGSAALNGPLQNPPVIPSGPPPASTNVTLTGTLPRLTANWNSIPNVYAYSVVLTTGGTTVVSTTVTASNLSYTFSNLTQSVYTVQVAGINPAGTGPPTGATWYELPGTPTSVVATAPIDTVTAVVSWTPPASGGTPLSYTVTSVADPTKYCTYAVGASPANQCTVTGLTPGSTYTFTVTASNQGGVGTSSSPSNPVTVGAPPGAPAAPTFTYTPGATTAQVSWLAPASNGGGVITGYTLVANQAGFGCVTVAPTTTCNITGLLGGTSYTFAVRATNQYGYGPLSPNSAPLNARTPPGAPTAVSATSGNTSATITWSPPASNGGSALTGYTVTGSPGGSCSTSSTSCTVSGLTNGVSYTFTVVAINTASGAPTNSVASTPSNAVTPAAAPAAPTNVVAVADPGGLNRATISWNVPSNGGSPITGYTVTSAPDGLTCTTASTSCTVTGLTYTTPYNFTVVATNAIGPSPAGGPSNTITIATPTSTTTTSSTTTSSTTTSSTTTTTSGTATTTAPGATTTTAPAPGTIAVSASCTDNYPSTSQPTQSCTFSSSTGSVAPVAPTTFTVAGCAFTGVNGTYGGSGNSVTFTSGFNNPGSAPCTVTATDAAGSSGSTSVSLTQSASDYCVIGGATTSGAGSSGVLAAVGYNASCAPGTGSVLGMSSVYGKTYQDSSCTQALHSGQTNYNPYANSTGGVTVAGSYTPGQRYWANITQLVNPRGAYTGNFGCVQFVVAGTNDWLPVQTPTAATTIINPSSITFNWNPATQGSGIYNGTQGSYSYSISSSDGSCAASNVLTPSLSVACTTNPGITYTINVTYYDGYFMNRLKNDPCTGVASGSPGTYLACDIAGTLSITAVASTGTALTAPSGLSVATSPNGSFAQATASWSPSTGNSGAVTYHYNFQGSGCSSTTTATSAPCFALAQGTSYTFSVYATDPTGAISPTTTTTFTSATTGGTTTTLATTTTASPTTTTTAPTPTCPSGWSSYNPATGDCYRFVNTTGRGTTASAARTAAVNSCLAQGNVVGVQSVSATGSGSTWTGTASCKLYLYVG
jgi:prepilin-type N-terminal cleavage/methylation domain-containing protein